MLDDIDQKILEIIQIEAEREETIWRIALVFLFQQSVNASGNSKREGSSPDTMPD